MGWREHEKWDQTNYDLKVKANSFYVLPGFTRPLLTRTPLRRPAPVLKRPATEDEERIKFTDSKGNVRVGIVSIENQL